MKYNNALKDRIYELMNGSENLDLYIVPESQFVEDEFADGKPCERLYQEIYDANIRLCDRLGREEDEDVETILRNFMEINKICAKKMFDYGATVASMPEQADCHPA